MATLSSQLSSQLLKYLRKHPDVTQKEVAEYLNLSPSFLSEIISGKKNLNGVAAMKLSQFLEKPAGAAIDPTVKQFSFKGKKLSSHLEHIRFGENSGWTPGTGNSAQGQDPLIGSSIDTVSDADTSMDPEAVTATLRKVRSIYRKGIRAINQYIVQSKVNKTGSTAPNRQRFSTRKINKALYFATDDSPAATKELLSVLGSLDMATRQDVILAILKAFPY